MNDSANFMSRNNRKNVVRIVREANFAVSMIDFIEPLVHIRMAYSAVGSL